MIPYTYRARVLRWVDGDTLDVRLDLGFRVFKDETVRLAGVNAPETRSADPAERAAGLAAKAFAEQLAPAGTDVTARTEKGGSEKYGRYLAAVVLADGSSAADRIIAAGHGKPYDGGPRA